MQIVPNPDPDADPYEIEVGRLIPLSGGNVDFPLGEGLLNFLYTDFEAVCDPEQIDFEQEQEMRPVAFESEAEQKVFDYLCLAETVKHFRPVIYCSRHFRKSAQKKSFQSILHT